MRLNVRLHYKALTFTSIFSKGFQNTCHTHHTVHSHFCTQNYFSQTLCLTPKRHQIDLIGKTLWQHFKKSRSIYSSCCRSNRSNIFTLSEQKYSSFCSQLSARQYSQDSVSDRTEINNQNLSVSKKLIMAAKNMQPKSSVKQNFDFFLVLDFEATCDKVAQPNPQEIIEFPVLKVNATTMKVDSIFHQYVRPQFHPQLTTFCTELTGIIQAMVDNQPHLPQVLQSFHEWMSSEGLLDPKTKSIFVTCGDWDLKTMLPKQCTFLELSLQPYFTQWINIKKSYADVTSVFPKGMMVMLNNLNLKHVGRHHSGIDDCHNIANVLIALMQRGYIFKQNGNLNS